MTTYTDGARPSVSPGPPEPGDEARPADEAQPLMPRQSLGVEDSGPAWVNAEIQRRMREAASRPGGRHARRERGEVSDEEQPDEPQAAAAVEEDGRAGGDGERQWPPVRQASRPRLRNGHSPDPYRSDGGVGYSAAGLRPPPDPVPSLPPPPQRTSPARHAESPPAGSRPVTPPAVEASAVRAPVTRPATPAPQPPLPQPPTPPSPVGPSAPGAAAFVAQGGDDVTAEHPRVDEWTAPGPRLPPAVDDQHDRPENDGHDDDDHDDDDRDGGFVATEDDEDDSQVLWSAASGPAALDDETPLPRPGAPAADGAPHPDPYADYLSAADGVSAVEQTMPYPATGQIDHASGRVRVVLSERRQHQRSVRTVQDVQDLTSVGDLLRSNLINNQLGLALRVAAVAVLTLGSLPALFALFPEIGQVDILGLRLPWLLLGVLVYPFLLLLGWWHTRSAEKVEQEFADHVQD
ncbi:hypothetical protein [Pseudonocardia sp.]|uniref:hypothetical protein n=1 Tax=Pseudonocardia sp. TaxID=60912 RepID=UPI003D0A606A